MRRFANALVVVSFVGSMAVSACHKDDPVPQNVTQQERAKTPSEPDKPSPFSNPDEEPPGPRSGDLPAPAEVAKLLADAKAHVEGGRRMTAITVLRRCSNKVPPSVACEAAMGIALTRSGSYRAHARYYLAQAADIDDPAVPADTYRKLANVAHDDGQYETSASALSIVRARGEATADDLSALAAALSADPQRRSEAAEAYGKAYNLEQTRYEDLRKRAVLLAQLGRNTEALAAFEEYRDKAGAHSPHLVGIENRIEELKSAIEGHKGR